MCGPLPKIFTQFKTKIWDFPYPFYVLTKTFDTLFKALPLNQWRAFVDSLIDSDKKVASSPKKTKPNSRPRVQKPFPIWDRNGRNLYHISDQNTENHTLWGHAYLCSPFKGVLLAGIAAVLSSKVTVWSQNVLNYRVRAGAIIGNGDRKSWDPRAPMIWDNFSIFRTNCAILTSYIRADPRSCRGLSRGCCHVAWSNGESCEILLRIVMAGNKAGDTNQGAYM